METSKEQPNKTLFQTHGVTVNFGGLKALNGVSVAVGENEIRGLIGPNGAGKTTFFNVATGFIEPSSGDIFFQGENVSRLEPHEIAKRGMIRTFQKRGIFPELTALENVLVGYHRLLKDVKLWHIGFRLNPFQRLEKKAIGLALEVLDSVGLGDAAHHLAKDLSFGQQTLVEMARALIARPKLLLLDEPAAGLSSSERDHVSKILRSLAEEQGVSLMITDHVMDFVMDVCNHLTVLNFGEILAEGTADQIRQHPRVLEAYIGTGEN